MNISSAWPGSSDELNLILGYHNSQGYLLLEDIGCYLTAVGYKVRSFPHISE